MTQDGRPPLLGTWRRIYACVVLYLAALIALFSWFTWSWNR
jgi:HAMP domain-containing protein